MGSAVKNQKPPKCKYTHCEFRVKFDGFCTESRSRGGRNKRKRYVERSSGDGKGGRVGLRKGQSVESVFMSDGLTALTAGQGTTFAFGCQRYAVE